MKLKYPGRKNKFYLNIFISITLCIVITLVVVSTVLYVNFERIASAQVYTDDIKNLTQTSREVAVMANTAMTLSNQIFKDINISKLLYYSELDVYDNSAAMNQLATFRLTMPFIDSIYIYNGKVSTFYVASSTYKGFGIESVQLKEKFADKQVVDIIDNYINYSPFIPVPRKIVLKYGEDVEKYYYTFLMFDRLSGKVLDGAVIVNISEDWIHKVMTDEENDSQSDTFIINDKGLLVSNSKNYSMMTDISDKDYIKSILSGSASSGYGLYTINGVKSLVTSTKPDPFGWRYVRVTPWSNIVAKIQKMRETTIIISFVIFIAGILFSFLVSGWLYVPIGKIQSKISDMEIEMRNNSRELKQEFLRDIILERDISNMKDVEKNFKNLGIKINATDDYVVVLFKIDSFQEFSLKYNAEDRNLYKFAVMNIACEIFSENYRTEAVDMGNDSVLVLLNYSSDHGFTTNGTIFELLKSIQDAVASHLHFSVSVAVSTEGRTIDSISQLHNQVQEASLHRLFYGRGCIIFAKEILQLKSKEYTFPFQKEKLLIDTLMSGKTGEAKGICSEIIQETAEYPFSVFTIAVSHLVFSINDAVSVIIRNKSLWTNLNFELPVIFLNNVETIEEINHQFYDLLDKISSAIKEKKNSRHDDLIQQINGIINLRYSDRSLSVDGIAEELKMSTPHLCRLYKQYSLCTVLDTIIEARMKKARELLVVTEISVAEVSEKVGFSDDTYFYRIFKKLNGVTPNEYRKNTQK